MKHLVTRTRSGFKMLCVASHEIIAFAGDQGIWICVVVIGQAGLASNWDHASCIHICLHFNMSITLSEVQNK